MRKRECDAEEENRVKAEVRRLITERQDHKLLILHPVLMKETENAESQRAAEEAEHQNPHKNCCENPCD